MFVFGGVARLHARPGCGLVLSYVSFVFTISPPRGSVCVCVRFFLRLFRLCVPLFKFNAHAKGKGVGLVLFSINESKRAPVVLFCFWGASEMFFSEERFPYMFFFL